MQHLLRDLGHAREQLLVGDRAVVDVAARRFGDVHRQIADPLEVGVDLDRRDDDAQVDRHRLLQGQELEGAIVDAHLAGVDVAVADRHLVERVQVADGEAADGLGQPRRHRRALQLQLALELVDAGLEVASRRSHVGHGEPSRTVR